MLIQNRKHAKAMAVLCILAENEEFIKQHSIEPYLNGREQGFAISDYKKGKTVAWSEYRNSNSFVVYVGNSSEFNMSGNTPSNEVWKNATFFHPDDYLKVAMFINKQFES